MAAGAAAPPDAWLGFAPSGARGRAVDQAVRDRLADSLGRIIDAAEGRLDCDAPSLRTLAATIRARRVAPGVMGLYASLVPALFREAPAVAEALLARLAAPGWREAAVARVVTLEDAWLGPGMAAIYQEHLGDDPSSRFGVAALAPAALAAVAPRVAAAQALLQAALPELAAESATLVHEILLVRPEAADGLVFHGASSFYLWGALALNIEAFADRVALAEGLAHEAGHGLLHGLTLGAPLVENPPEQRHASPLREDPRPLDGVAHATFVLARMHLALAGMLGSGLLSAAERAAAEASLAQRAAAFREGMAVLRDAARFTPEGAAIMAGAAGYMAGV